MPQLWTRARLATATLEGRWTERSDMAFAVDGERIAWVGPQAEVPEPYSGWELRDAEGRWVMPAFIDCHTHLVYAGSRFNEFEMRQRGASYEDIAAAGGGINFTVRETRAASVDALLAQSLPRIRALVREGVTTLEIKSGYGLSLEPELRCLRVARNLGERLRVDVRTSFLGAHAVPADFRGRPDDYITYLVDEMLPAVHEQGLADMVDAYCESHAFSVAQIERVFRAAQALELPIRLHAEQRSNQHGARLAARLGALSCDHLEHLDVEGVRAMAKAGTVAVLLPGAYYFLRDTQAPPVKLLRQNEVPIALASDLNPGTSPIASLLLALHMGCTLFGLTVQEALVGVTLNAARALGLRDRGRLAAGQLASFTLWDFEAPGQLAYEYGVHRPRAIVHRGRNLL